ncbi:MAG: hypothetical protein ACRD15_13455, partial [Vicinamibacterales bacterium]
MAGALDRVRLLLHNDQTVHSIAEMLRPRLQIINGSDRPITFGNGFVFDWESLSFAPPNAVHLIDPESQDLALPYTNGAHVRQSKRITVGPGAEEWLFLPIYAFFHLRMPGRYTFSIELADDGGRVHKSNVVEFRLTDVEQTTPPDAVVLTLSTERDVWSVKEAVFVNASFTNRASRPVTILEPQEDSFYGWVNPIYQFTVIDDVGRSLPLALRGGSMATPRYDEASRTTMAPGSSSQRRLRVPDIPLMRYPGQYRVTLTYV